MIGFIKKICTTTFTSFTVCVLFLCLFLRLGLTDYGTGTLLPTSILMQFFVFCASIAILMPLMEKLENLLDFSSLFLDTAMRLFLCYLVVFLEGSAFGVFAFTLRSFLDITPVMLPVFAVTWIVHYISTKEYTEAVNKAIEKKRKQQP